jgi:hypothetical protein
MKEKGIWGRKGVGCERCEWYKTILSKAETHEASGNRMKAREEAEFEQLKCIFIMKYTHTYMYIYGQQNL